MALNPDTGIHCKAAVCDATGGGWLLVKLEPYHLLCTYGGKWYPQDVSHCLCVISITGLLFELLAIVCWIYYSGFRSLRLQSWFISCFCFYGSKDSNTINHFVTQTIHSHSQPDTVLRLVFNRGAERKYNIKWANTRIKSALWSIQCYM